MSKVSMDLVKELREKTQVSFMECKNALELTNGNVEQALEVLRKKGAAVAAKRSENAATNGRIEAFISPDYKLGAMVEAGCETDFSANTDSMRDFVTDAAKVVATSNPATPDELLTLKSISNPKQAVKANLEELLVKISEKILINKFVRYEVKSHGLVNAYIHPGSTVGVIIELETDKQPTNVDALKDLAKDLCMQVAVMKPLCVEKTQLDPALVEKEREIAKEQLKTSGKPAPIIEKIVEGKLNKYYEDVCLENQLFIKNDSLKIKQHIDEVGLKLGLKIKAKQFVRYAIKR